MRRSPITIPLLFAAAAATGAASAPPPKIDNILERPLAASEAQFVEAAMVQPTKGACEVLSPDRAFREEMLLDVSSIGAPGGRKYERRVALVVGNGAYTAVTSLPNPPNDATSMARMFRALGFTVYRAIDATEAALDNCFARFKGDLQKPDAQGRMADIALFFYAGHGLQLTGAADNEKRNYMMSVDASVDRATGKAKGFRQIDPILTEMRAHAKQAVFLYDACRNAPYKEGTVKEADGKAVRASDASVGAAPVDAKESKAASAAGIFIAYATSPGRPADDGWGPAGSKHSPFTEALLKSLATPGATIDQALAQASNMVGELTNWQQTPWISSSLVSSSSEERLTLNGSMSQAEIRSRSSDLAAQSAAAGAQGLRGAAIAAALKGQPRRWSVGERALAFGTARAELFRAFASKAIRFVGHTGEIQSAAFNSKGDRIVTGSGDGTAKIWHAATGGLLKTLGGHAGPVTAAFSKDGALVVTGSETARVWSSSTGGLLRTIGGNRIQRISARFSPDGKYVVIGSLREAQVWDAQTGALLRSLKGHANSVMDAVFSPDGTIIVTVSLDQTARIWDVETGVLLRTLRGPYGRFNSAAFSPDGERIVTGGLEDPTARIWDVRTGARLRAFAGHTGSVSAAFSVDGTRIVTGSNDGTAKIWDVASGEVITTVSQNSSRVLSAEFGPDGSQFVTGYADFTARIWPGTTLSEVKFLGHDNWVDSVDYSDDGTRIVTGSRDRTAKVWDARTGQLIKTLLGHEGDVSSAAFGPNGRLVVTGSGDKTARIWDAKSGVLLRTLRGHKDIVSSAAFSPDGRRVVTASWDLTAIVWDTETGAILKSIERHALGMQCAAFSPDGRRIVTASEDRTVKIWDSGTGALVRTFEESAGAVFQATFSPDGALVVTASDDQTARVWEASSGRLLRTLAGHSGRVTSANFSPDGTRVVTGSLDKSARIWDAATGSLLMVIDGQGDNISDAAFSPDGARVVTGTMTVVSPTRGTAKVWDAGLYGPELLEAAYALLTDEQRVEVERQRIRYWEVDPKLLE